ncbi:hypothetical protein V6U81_21235 [Micromonospora sp. CPCC 205711]|uniref:hypothetical protein n=1 Tax=Micromonospora sp. CPCC 205547 TaxID=3122400 RepID=UPI002FF09ACB
MGEVLPMPGFGDLFTDTRGDDRTMRVSYHPERGAVVLSLWHGTTCRGSFRMAVGDVATPRTLLAEIEASAAPPAPLPTVGGPGATVAVGGRAAPPAPAVDQTGDISGTAHRGALPILPVPRVA